VSAPLCIYHGTCFDGFGAAWVVRRAYRGDVDFHPGVYGEPPPDVTGRHVVLVDFSYKRPVLESLAAQAASLLVLDHHKTAAADLEGFPNAEFDMERSGAGIAWDHFFPDERRPALIDYIEDRDLWRFALPDSRLIHAGLSSYPFDFAVWDVFMASYTRARDLAAEGAVVERKHWQDIAALLPVVRRRMVIGGVDVPVANMPITMTSDAGHTLAEDEPFAACYWDTPQGRVFSLRSRDGGADVSKIAAQYGGGGHEHAAGFQVPRGWEGE